MNKFVVFVILLCGCFGWAESATAQSERREPVVAGLLSLAWPGLGQFYNGPSEKRKGTIMAAVQAGALVVMVAAVATYGDDNPSTFADPSLMLSVLTLGSLTMTANSLYSMYDAATSAEI
ncbi:MAG: hypothetical protein O3A46_06340 [Candidatus Poribacteria bacterium]|nr:hypothetical protein [Candidatus Poribacteria bacterium]